MGRERETGPQAGQAEDPELLRRCREGDISALAELYDRYVDWRTAMPCTSPATTPRHRS